MKYFISWSHGCSCSIELFLDIRLAQMSNVSRTTEMRFHSYYLTSTFCLLCWGLSQNHPTIINLYSSFTICFFNTFWYNHLFLFLTDFNRKVLYNTYYVLYGKVYVLSWGLVVIIVIVFFIYIYIRIR
jgi:hypothetical protein